MNLDQLLNFIAILGWLFFIVFAIVIFSRTLMRSGFGRAVIELLSGRVLVPLLCPTHGGCGHHLDHLAGGRAATTGLRRVTFYCAGARK
jgi:hypothetical protein